MRHDPLESRPAASHYSEAFKVVIVYEDTASDNRAQRLCASLMNSRGSRAGLQQTAWKFELLRTPQLKSIAARDARAADMVILSTHQVRNLPADVKEWFALCFDNTCRQPQTLVALQDQADGCEESAVAPRFLHEAARKSGMGYFANMIGTEAGDRCFIWMK